jgi:hypothetical protein
LPMSKLRRRRADRCTFPIKWGHNGEAGVTIRGGADRLRPHQPRNRAQSRSVPTGTYALNVPTGTFVPAMA